MMKIHSKESSRLGCTSSIYHRETEELIDAPIPIVRDSLGKQEEHLQEERKNMDALISVVHELIRDMEERLK